MVFVTTGTQDDMAIDKKVGLYVYMRDGVKGPIVIGEGKKGGLFQSGQTDEIKINLGPHIQDLYKIRIGFTGKTGGSWFVEKVVLRNLSTEDEYEFTIYRWLSRVHDDGDTWREAALAVSGQNSPANTIYQIEVTTGNVIGADTKADVYINIFGQNADCGKRYLHKTNFREKTFQMGKTNIFEIEAVPLGLFEKIVVGHNVKTAGAGWFLEKVVITDMSNEETHFICNKWLDIGKSDKKIERTIFPDIQKIRTPPKRKSSRIPSQVKPVPVKTVQKDKPKPVSVGDGCFQVYVKTKPDSNPANGGWVTLTAYGTKGKSEAIQLLPPPNFRERLFEPDNLDEFEINVGDIGDLYKLQVNRDDDQLWQGWHLEQIRLVDRSNDEEYTFDYNCWLLRDDVGNTLLQELPVKKDNKPLFLVHTYRLSIYTGDHWAGETDSNIFVTIYGQNGDSGRRGLYQPVRKPLKFMKGTVETLEFDAVDLQDLTKIVVSHDGVGHGAGWFLDKIVVTETTGQRAHLQHVFPCGKWLDNGISDGLTERELRLLDIKDSSVRSVTRSKSKSQGKWKVTVKTSDLKGSGTHARVYLTIFGTTGHSETIPLGKGGPKSDDFQDGKEADFMITINDIGIVTKIRLEHNNENLQPSWHLDWVKLVSEENGEDFVFYADCWLADNEDDKQICRELPVIKSGQPSLPVLQYIVCMQTGKDQLAEASDAVISISLIGQKGGTGVRPLVNSLSGNKELWLAGGVNYFSVQAVDVGELEKIRVVFDGDGSEKNWYLERVTIRKAPAAFLETVFECQQWFEVPPKTADVTIEFLPKETKFASALPEIVQSHLCSNKPSKSKGRWTISTYIGSEGNVEPNDLVYLTVFGTTSISNPIQINKNSAFQPYSIVQTSTNLSDIGMIYKIQIHHDFNIKSSYHLNRIKLKDDDSNEEYNFEVNDLIKTSEDEERTVTLTAIRPDVPPLQETTYLVKITTGTDSLSETEARVYCSLIGHLGESGEMALIKPINGSGDIFSRGQENVFEIKTLDVGNIQKIKIGHKESGRGCGWYCDSVIVSSTLPDSTQYIFTCDRWLDSGCDDRNLMIELSPLASLPHHDTIPLPVKTKSQGIWMCTVASATQDNLSPTAGRNTKHVSLLVFGKLGVFGPFELVDKKRKLFLPGQKDIFHGLNLGYVGEIEKIRLISGSEDDPRPEWTIQQLSLRDEETGELLLFDYNQWVGEVGGDICKEMPVIKSDQNFNKVVKYFVSFHTSEKKGGGTNSEVFLTIFGTASDSGKRKLIRIDSNKTVFKAGQIDNFYIQCVDLGNLEKVLVTKGPGEPWLLNRIVIKKQQYASEEYVFELNRWLSKDSRTKTFEDTQILSSVQQSTIVASLDNSSKQPQSKGNCKVTTVTGPKQSTAASSDIVLVFCGTNGESSPIPLHVNSNNVFQPNQTNVFQVQANENIGELLKVRIGYHDNTHPKTWNLQKITFQDIDTHDKFSYNNNNNDINIDDKHDGWVEIPVEWPAVKPLPVLKYEILLYGDPKKPPTKNQLYCQLYGENGLTGRRLLKKPVAGGSQKDVFQYEIEAVDLKMLHQVLFGHNNNKKGAGFKLQKLIVKESILEGREFVFECNEWFDTGQGDQQIERLLKKEIDNAPAKPPVVVKAQPKPEPIPVPPPKKQEASGDWKVEIYTSDDIEQSGTDANVVLTIFGNLGNSGPLPLGEPGIGFFEPGHMDEFEIFLEPSEIGPVRKIRLEHDNTGQSPGWHVEKVCMENLGNKEEIVFPINRWLAYDNNDYSDTVVEIPAVLPNTKVPEVYRYLVETTTSNDKESDTESNVYINIIGTEGDSGKRLLKQNLRNTVPFLSGATDSFEIEAVDLGKIQKVIIGHDGTDSGSGWKLDNITVRQSRTSSEVYVFKYGKWLDKEKGSKKTEVELKLTQTKADIKPNLDF